MSDARITVPQHWLRERTQAGDLHVTWLDTNRMLADGLTKLLPPQNHKDLRAILDKIHFASFLVYGAH